MHRNIRVAAALATLALLTAGAAGQQINPASGDGKLPDRELLNAATVTVITAPVGGPMSIMGSDMANVLDSETLRVLPILGKGSVQNLIDIMRLKNVDMGFVASDALEFVKIEYDVPDIAKRVRYIAKLFINDVHIIARKDIRSLGDLAGKKIFAERNLGYASTRIIFDRLGIAANIDSKTDADGGLQKLLNGEADAWIVSTGKVAPVVKGFKNEGNQFHLLSIPYDRALQDIYLPSSFSPDEYPNLVARGETVDTVSTSTVLMVYNWPLGTDRYNRVMRFVEALFSKIGQLQQPPRHVKWRDTVLSATVPGLQRFKAAQDWLDRHTPAATTPSAPDDFRRFVAQKTGRESLSAEEAAQLYSEFLVWRRSNGH